MYDDSAWFARLTRAGEDMQLAQFFARHLLKNEYHFDFMKSRRRLTTYRHQIAYVTAFVIHYARPFTKAHGWPMLDQSVLPYTTVERSLHDRLLTDRHQLWAHTDGDHFGARAVSGMPFTIYRRPPLHVECGDLNVALRMIPKAMEHFGGMARQRRANIDREIEG
jgi:hypothetical protein